jgi:hypothetical protein
MPARSKVAADDLDAKFLKQMREPDRSLSDETDDDDPGALPETPETLTIGDLRRKLYYFDKMHRAAGSGESDCDGTYTTEQWKKIRKFRSWMSRNAAFKALSRHSQIEQQEYVTSKFMKEITHRLVIQLGKTIDEIDQFTVLEALAILRHHPDVGDEAMDRFFYDEMCKPKHVSGTNQQILDRAKKEHPEWPCPGSIQGMRERAEAYRALREKPTIPARKHKPK